MRRYFIRSIHKLMLFGVAFCLLVETVSADQIKVAFINPTYPNEPFWSLMTDLMVAAAKDLDIDLQVHYSERNRFKSLEITESILASEDKPDYLIFHFQAQMGAKMLQAAENAKVHSLVINTDVPKIDASEIGAPRGKYTYWIGHILPDDFSAGATLASSLLAKAKAQNKQAKDAKIHMIGLTGTGDNTASVERELGINSIINQRDDVVLHQIVNASWEKEKAAQITKVLMQRYPETSVIWSASDLMGLGAIESLEELGLDPGKDVLVGGIDGAILGLDAVQKGQMSASVSGHFVEGAWALLLLYDHFHGKDILLENGLVLQSVMDLVDDSNVEIVLSKINSDYFEQIDFKSFSASASLSSTQKYSPLSLPKILLSQFVEVDTDNDG